MLVMITLPLILAVWLAKWFVVFLHRGCEMEILKGFEVINLKQPKGESVMTVTSNSLKFNKATAVELNYAPYIISDKNED